MALPVPRLLLASASVVLCVAAWPAAAQQQAPAAGQAAPAPQPAPQPAPAPVSPPQADTIVSLAVTGQQRVEPATVLSYTDLAVGQAYDRERLDRALRDLFASDLFADVRIRDDEGRLTIEVRENPVINRVVVEGARRIKEDKIRGEIRLAPRQVFTPARARADVQRILELYRRSGRFAARVEPKIVELDQNRVDLVFEINEGPQSKIRQINILGNERFSDSAIRGEMVSRQARRFRIFTSNDTYDPDRIAFDQQRLRQFYLTEGFADFRVVSAIAELTPDRRDFILTYVLDEGERYRFGEVDLVSQLRDVPADQFRQLIPVSEGDWYNARRVEETIDSLTETVGLLGYAFADIRPNFSRDRENLQMNVTFVVNESPRVYVEEVTIAGNTRTRDEVIRREFRIAEGDAFNSFKVRRSRDRIQSLGFFQDKLEVQQRPGSEPDKVSLAVEVEERPTGSLQLSAGFSSLERFILAFSIEERNFRGRAQQLRLGANISSFSRSVELGFVEPYIGGRNIALGADIFRRDFNNFRFGIDNRRDTTYQQTTTGFQVRAGSPVTEYLSASVRYGLSYEQVSLDESLFFTQGVCDPLLAGRFLCDAIGNRVSSVAGYSLVYDSLDNRLRPSRGQRMVWNQDVAGLGGDVRYVRSRVNYDRYWNIGRGFILNLGGEAGNIVGFGQDVRLTDRFFLGEPRLRGFNIRGVGPRVIRKPRVGDNQEDPNDDMVVDDRRQWVDDSIGGRNYYLGRAELEIPLGAGARELGLRPSAFVDVGALWGVRRPELQRPPTRNETFPVLGPDGQPQLDPITGLPLTQTITIPGFIEEFLGDSPTPRVSVGVGVSWNSPFGPFRFDIARAIRKVEGDDTQIFQFNVGTSF